MPRNTRKKNFILVAEIITKYVKIIIEGPNEQALKKTELVEVDMAIERKTNKLFQKYPPHTHEVIRTRASDINDLKQDFLEFSGWDTIASQQLTKT